jgi:UDP:flavonoid glycosyltransferase YjiC (YdhE family)
VHEMGLGRRLDTYACSPAELHAAIQDLLADDDLRARLAGLSRAIQSRDGVTRAAALIEQTARSTDTRR